MCGKFSYRVMAATVVGAAVLAAGAASANAGLIWSEDFESLTPGAISTQGNWFQDLGINADATVVNDAGTAYQGSQFLQLNYSGGSGNTSGPRLADSAISGTPVNSGDTYVLSMALRFTATGPNGLLTHLYADSGSHDPVYTYFNANGEIFSVLGNTFNDTGKSIATNTWYNVTYTVNPTALTYEFAVRKASDNTTVLDTTVPFTDGIAIANWYEVQFQQDAGVGNAFQIDSLSLTDNPVPEPVTGSLLLIGGGLLALRRRRK